MHTRTHTHNYHHSINCHTYTHGNTQKSRFYPLTHANESQMQKKIERQRIFTHTHKERYGKCNIIRAECLHTFSLCLMCWWESERVGCIDRAHFSLFLWSECVTGDLFSQPSRGSSLFWWIWSIWSIQGPLPCSTLEKWPIHLDLSQCITALRSCLHTASQTRSRKHSGPWSHYVIYLSVVLTVHKGKICTDTDKAALCHRPTTILMCRCEMRKMAWCERQDMVHVGKVCLPNEPLQWEGRWIASGYYIELCC